LGEGVVFAEPPRRAFDVDDHRAVQEAVEDGGGDDAVASEEFSPATWNWHRLLAMDLAL